MMQSVQYIFGVERYKGKDIEVVKVVSDRPTDLTGNFNIKQNFSDNTRTDMFHVVKKIRTASNGEKFYDWYEIMNHIRFDDSFIPKREELEEDGEGLFDVAELADENSVCIEDLAEIVSSQEELINDLTARVEALENK